MANTNRVSQWLLDDGHFNECTSCGSLMRNHHNQHHIMANRSDCPATTIEEVQAWLKSDDGGPRDSYEVKPGLCDECSKHY